MSEVQRFFQVCGGILIENLRETAVLDKLWSRKIITEEEREKINNLNSARNVDILISVLETR